jgi:hypothetical protein
MDSTSSPARGAQFNNSAKPVEGRHAVPPGAKRFFRGTVRPTVDEFFRDVRDIRRGRLAAIVLFHMADLGFGNDPNANKRTLKELHEQLIKDCPDFGLISDIANASKHDRLTMGTDRKLSSSDQITRTPGTFHAPFNTAAFNEASIVIVTHDDGKSQPLGGVVRSVLEMWEAKIQ